MSCNLYFNTENNDVKKKLAVEKWGGRTQNSCIMTPNSVGLVEKLKCNKPSSSFTRKLQHITSPLSPIACTHSSFLPLFFYVNSGKIWIFSFTFFFLIRACLCECDILMLARIAPHPHGCAPRLHTLGVIIHSHSFIHQPLYHTTLNIERCLLSCHIPRYSLQCIMAFHSALARKNTFDHLASLHCIIF